LCSSYGGPQTSGVCIRLIGGEKPLSLNRIAYCFSSDEAKRKLCPGTESQRRGSDVLFWEIALMSPKSVSGYLHCFRHSPEMYLIAGASRVMGLHRQMQIQIGLPLRLPIYRQLGCSFCGVPLNKLASAPASATRIRCPFRSSSTDVGYIDKRIVAAAVGANG
jgi:hypothetical protein